MYTDAERIAISFLDTINQLRKIQKRVKNNGDDENSYIISQLIVSSINNIERNGGKVRLNEDNILTLAEFNEICSSQSKL